jgi:hypothetical protein
MLEEIMMMKCLRNDSPLLTLTVNTDITSNKRQKTNEQDKNL